MIVEVARFAPLKIWARYGYGTRLVVFEFLHDFVCFVEKWPGIVDEMG